MQAGVEDIDAESVVSMAAVDGRNAAHYQRRESLCLYLVGERSLPAGKLLRQAISKKRNVAEGLKSFGMAGST